LSDYKTNASFIIPTYIQGGPKTGLFMGVDNFAMINRKKACDMSKVAKFCLE